ncbi:glucokinase [Legionella moravica]|uniref:Glucokinase n=1 Tax=Legionella moravica TaxID=39962 RepID=A0A378JTW1_9GAMM|nr:glucokinase [Legionella moravica]KTD32634.1 glucokinase [Legionella moravica]STX61460.1 glucokinase [Legionella moravica]
MTAYDLMNYAIVADIGGTFARFSRVNLVNLQMDKIEVYPCATFSSIDSAFIAYQTHHSLQELKRVAIAIACPVIDDLICMTNCHWQFSIKELKSRLNLTELRVMNDFTAIAMSLPVLSDHDLLQIGTGYSDPNKVRVVLGAGTGLGVAYLVPNEQSYTAYAGEGGHADWGAKSEQEWFIYTYLKNHYPHVSLERILSGHGLENLYKAIAAYRGLDKASLKAADIISLALTQECPIAQATVEQFFICLGAYSGDMALTYGAFGGVYIAGGIVPRLASLIKQSQFRACFEDKGRFSDFNALIPTYMIKAEQPGILGAATSLRHSIKGACDVVS